MHSTAFSTLSPTTTCHTQACADATPVSTRSTTNDADAFVNYSSPQCCHCGWRGSHAPNCPFKRH
ncbi:hypothetical protein PILCRDRAFT_820567 [Piloderma croceum F 1598]|uniref:Uncharacterized protein n=1 Tax=Piloderma croceum (strain F 1598) TaxID=765440 RepID=A0A0C3FC61_PILCF|nr:hypothetical protein PILCRDRAFT_820567 [Piloderma croceum F 1598]